LSALTFWCILKWEHISEQEGANRWLILIAYLLGLGIGVHLLNLLVIPAIVYVYYFKKYNFDTKGFFIASGIGLAILAFVQVGVIPGIPTLAAWFDRYFVNDLGMGFGSGVIAFALVLFVPLIAAIWWSHVKGKVWLNTSLLAFAFILIGYSSYSMVVIRSLANPPIDMNNPEEPFNLVSYLNREQYGDRPLLKGPYFNAQAIDVVEGKKEWRKGTETYEDAGIRPEYVWDPKYITVFPRMGDQQKASSPAGYAYWADVDKNKVPTMGQNMAFFLKYQLGHMYWRYFLWNFAGRQNMMQGDGDPINGNWISGITFLDEFRLGPQSNLPDFWKNDKSRNTYFMLPLILGIMGFLYQLGRNRNDFFIVTMLFLFTGILIAVYLNAPPYEPRERDYTLVGSFQIFCIWIGLGVLQFFDWLKKTLRPNLAASTAVAVSLVAVPLLLAAQNWDDHDRSERNMVVEYARDYLASCDENAILFTNGDNDTYPLWYVQNVERYRTDVRVVNLQLLNFDWYVEALTKKVMDSEPFTLSVSKEKYAKGLREQVTFYENPELPANQNEYYPFDQVLKFITDDENPKTKRPWYFGERVNYFPVRNMKIPVDKEKAFRSGTFKEEDLPYAVDELRFTIQASALLKADWILLDLIQQNQFERPIYFASNSINANHLGLGSYFRMDGLVYRLVPVNKPNNPRIPINADPDIFYDRLVNRFEMGGVNNPDVLMDEQSLRMCRTFRNYYGILAMQLALEGKKDSVMAVVDKVEKGVPGDLIPYEYPQMVIPIAQACYEVNVLDRGDEILSRYIQEQEAILKYYEQFTGIKKRLIARSLEETRSNLAEVYKIAVNYSRTEMIQKLAAYAPAYNTSE
ncbi:MAG: DUF2723 domain-containing protein, partial [Bacteroidota bacterium]|nr:DUF2723 domain-containing protein [Bacteroidota bacterium]MDX5430828.1 DUF2723 domain-containing protein [Bacteroidota bacterium]MDX5469572.1 DUF2723 domain-containing protein [Bacteroidota bacterium]